MSRSVLSALLIAALASRSALAQPDPNDPTPLTSKTYSYPDGIPYQVDYNTAAIRGPQAGFNICNSTTQNQQSLCQTLIFNNIGDMCLWAPPKPNSTIGDTEGVEVAWCSKPGHGTRLMPQGTILGVQVLKTSKYIQVAGFINQVQLNLAAGDYGGELDPHGADLRGNPIGGLVYSNAYSGNNSTYQQINDWFEFIGGDSFCFTMCDPSSSTSDQSAYCENRYDRMGCAYNAPNNAQNGTFEVCDADLKTPVGTYTSGGATMVFTQPFDGTFSVPYTASVPKSSNCVTYHSTDLYTGLPTPTPTGAPGATNGAVQSGRATGSLSAGSPAATANSASSIGMSSVAGVLGTLFAVAFLS